MGFPRFWGRLTAGEETVIGPDVGNDKREDNAKQPSDGRLGLIWTIAYYILLVIGAVSWKQLLWRMTESKSALTTF